jgi:hypothetical protein
MTDDLGIPIGFGDDQEPLYFKFGTPDEWPPDMTADQMNMVRYYLNVKNTLPIRVAMGNGRLTKDFDAVELVEFARKEGMPLSDHGLAIRFNERERAPGNYIPWNQAVKRLMDGIEITISRDSAVGRIRRACANGDIIARGKGRGHREIETTSLDAFILQERNKANAADAVDRSIRKARAVKR